MDNQAKSELINNFRSATHRLLLLDYDGTLVNFKKRPKAARPDRKVIDTLLRFVNDPHTDVYIITGRNNKDIDDILDHLPVNIIAEHGAFFREKGIWKTQIDDKCLWKNSLVTLMDQVTTSCPGSFIEEKSFCLAWHYRNTDTETGYAYSRQLISQLEKEISYYGLKILDGNKVVEIMNKDIGKGYAVKKLTEHRFHDLIVAIGDDVTDEEMFGYLHPERYAYTIKVGLGVTCAKYKVNTAGEVGLLLNELAL